MGPGSPWLLALIAVVSFGLSFIGAAVGLILGHLRLPLLIAYLGGPGAGAMTNLIISGGGALGGVVGHVRAGRVSWVALAFMGIPSAVGAVVAVVVFVQINPLWSYLVIGIMLVVSGANLVFKPANPEADADPISLARRLVIETVLGLGLGALAAVTGLMLGSLRLPMMIRLLRMDPKEAVGTNMAVGCLTAAVGAATAWCMGSGRLDWRVLAVVIPPTLLGGYLGGWLTGKISKARVQQLAGWIVAVTGVILVGQGTGGFLRRSPTADTPAVVVSQQGTNEYDGWFDFDFPDEEEVPWPGEDFDWPTWEYGKEGEGS